MRNVESVNKIIRIDSGKLRITRTAMVITVMSHIHSLSRSSDSLSVQR